jgi:hypothetical protein
MAHYFFHFHGADQPDHTGTELASAQAARDAAVIFMGERLKACQPAAGYRSAGCRAAVVGGGV